MSEDLDELTLPIYDDDENLIGYYRISASQIKTYLDCKRKWAWIYIAKIKPPPGEAASFGQRTHSILEKYQKDGIAWDHTTEEGRVARKALEFLPAPDSNALTEASFTFDTVRTGDDRPVSEGRHLLFNGFIDLTLPPNYSWEHTSTHPTIIDYKTCKTTQYALTVTTLPEDPQAIIYAYHAMAKYQTTHVDLMWLYLPRRTSTPTPVKVRLDWQETKTKFRQLEVLAREIERTHDAVTDPLTLPPTESSCDKYGGCPFKGRCNLQASKTPQQRQEEFMGFIEDMAARRAAEATAQQPAAPNATVVVTPSGNNTFSPEFLGLAAAANPPPQVDFLKQPTTLVQELTQREQRINPPEAPSLATYDPKLPIGQSAPLTQAIVAGVNPPGQPSTEIDGPMQFTPGLVGGDFIPAPITSAIPSSGQSTAVVTVTPVEAAPPSEKPKRTRRTKAQMEAARAELSATNAAFAAAPKLSEQETTDEVFEPQPGDLLVTDVVEVIRLPDPPSPQDTIKVAPGTKAATGTPVDAVAKQIVLSGQKLGETQEKSLQDPVRAYLMKPAAPTPASFTLYVNCAPSWQHNTVDNYIAMVQVKINEAYNVPDYRCIDFGKGRGILANEVKELVQSEVASGALQNLVIYTNNPEGQEVLSSLVALANGKVVRA